MVAVNSEEKEEMHGWYSEKQLCSNIKDVNTKIFETTNKLVYVYTTNKLVYVYYIDSSNNKILVSEVTKTNKYTSNWDDAVYLGTLLQFHGAFAQPI